MHIFFTLPRLTPAIPARPQIEYVADASIPAHFRVAAPIPPALLTSVPSEKARGVRGTPNAVYVSSDTRSAHSLSSND